MKNIKLIFVFFLVTSLLCTSVSADIQINETISSRGNLIISTAPIDFEDNENLPPVEKIYWDNPLYYFQYVLTTSYTDALGLPPVIFSQLLAAFTILLGAGALSLLVTRRKLPEDPESRPVIVYNAIKEHPGMSMAQIQKLTGIPRGSINYTIYRLSLAGKVKKTTENGAATYYPANIPVTGHEEFMNKVLTQDKPHKIFQTIVDRPGISQKKLIEETGIPQTTLQWHLSQLAKYHALDSSRDKNTVHYTAIPDYVLLYNQLAEENKQETETENEGDVDQIPKEKAKKNTKNINES